ncbi:MAG: LamG domain-containing protein, partial [Verrucomicrobiota bacterium]
WAFFRGGNYWLNDLTFSSSAPPTLNWGLFKDSVLSADGSMLKAMDYELGREVIKVYSADPSLFAIKSQKEAGTNKQYVHFNFKTTSSIGYYILVKGSPDGVSWSWYYICYLSGDGSSFTNGTTVYHYLGADVKSGKWVDIYRDLDRDLYVGFGVHLKEITWILTRGGNYYLNLAEFSDTPFKSDVGYWKLDEGAGTTAQDSSWRGNNGTLQGNPQWTSGRINGALSFNGSNYVDCGNDDSLKVSAITMQAWVYSPTTNFAGPNEIAGAEGAYGFNITDNCIKIHINTVSQGWHWCASSAPLVWDGWHHVAFTYDGVNTVKCYRDGVLIFTDTTSSSGPLQWAAWTTKLYIGQINTGSRMFHGLIDEVKISPFAVPWVD